MISIAKNSYKMISYVNKIVRQPEYKIDMISKYDWKTRMIGLRNRFKSIKNKKLNKAQSLEYEFTIFLEDCMYETS